MKAASSHFLTSYSAIVTLAFMFTVYAGFFHRGVGSTRNAEFDRIRVHRIDVIEPDGTERLILSNRTDYPGSFYHNKEVARPDRSDAAGLLMMNDEGTEDGGFIWGGLSRDGKPLSFSHLSFDQYEQDQTFAIDSSLEDGSKFAGIHMNDVQDWAINEQFIRQAESVKLMPPGPERQAAFAALESKYPPFRRRVALDRQSDGSVGLTLNDSKGQERLKLFVAKDGTPQIQFFDSGGHLAKTINGMP